MKYTKPEINILGEAAQVLQFIVSKPPFQILESVDRFVNPAYDLDD
jgi:hypothetical protein